MPYVNRLTRDQIIEQALDMADLPELDQQSRPTGAAVIAAAAFPIDWLQRIIDTLHIEFPWGGVVARATGSLASGSLNVTDFAPTDFILDVRNGFIIQRSGSTKRLLRRGLQEIIDRQTMHDLGGSPSTNAPKMYCFNARSLRLDITSDQAYDYILWYYQLPAALPLGTTVPLFPSDRILVDGIYIRALEWARKLPPNSMQQWLEKVAIPSIRNSDLGQEPESEVIPLDPTRFHGGVQGHPYDWLIKGGGDNIL